MSNNEQKVNSTKKSGKSIICSVFLAVDIIAVLVYAGMENYYDSYPTMLFKMFMIYMFYQIDWTSRGLLKWIWILFVGLMTLLSIGINIYNFSNAYDPEYGEKLIQIYTIITEIYDIYHLFFLIMCVLLVIFMIHQKNSWKEYFNILKDVEKLESDSTIIHSLVNISCKIFFIISIIKILIHIIKQAIDMENNSYILPSTIFSNHHKQYTRRTIQILYILFLFVSLFMKIQIHIFQTTMTKNIKFIGSLLIINILLSLVDEEYKHFAVMLFHYLSIMFILHTRDKNLSGGVFSGTGVSIA